MRHGNSGASVVLDVARARGRLDDPSVRDMVGEAYVLEVVGDELLKRVSETIRSGRRSDQVAAVGRLFKGEATSRIATLAFEVAGADGAAWVDDGGPLAAVNFLMRQGGAIGGGTTEMARNVIAERVLAMPRERTQDRDLPFRDVPRSRPSGA
jgi:alkylation response protein AidB-like acyl-CoA dehydrogenase